MAQFISLEEIKDILTQMIRSESISARERLSAIDRLAKIEKWFIVKQSLSEYEQLQLDFEASLNEEKIQHMDMYESEENDV